MERLPHSDPASIWDSLEQEQELIVNRLSRQLDILRKEKAEQFQQLEAEQEYIVNRLQKQLEAVRLQQASMPGGASAVSSAPAPPLTPGAPSIHSRESSAGSNSASSMSSFRAALPELPASTSVVDTLRNEVSVLRSKLVETEREYLAKAQQASKYRKELIDLRTRLNMPTDDLTVETTPKLLPIRSTSKDRSTSRRLPSKSPSTLPATARSAPATGSLARRQPGSQSQVSPADPNSSGFVSDTSANAATDESGDERSTRNKTRESSSGGLPPVSPIRLNG